MDTRFVPSRLSGTVPAPASKSEAHRRLVCAGLTKGETLLTGYMDSEDMQATLRCIEALGAVWRLEGDRLSVRGGVRAADRVPLFDCGESGSTLRFFVPIALCVTGGGVFRMHGRLSQRPMDVYRDLFVPAGVNWRMGIGADGAAELSVSGRMEAGAYSLPGNVSSQFVSGLLFALPLLAGDSTLKVTGTVESVGYIRMTVEALCRSGIRIEEKKPFCWKIPGGQTYRAESGALTGDYSQAAVLLCGGALGHDVTVTGLQAETTQGDRSVLAHLRALGAEVTEDEHGITVRPGHLRGAVLDMQDCPDIAPLLALVCQLSEGESRLTHCGRLRLKESDRLAETVRLLNALGGDAAAEGDDIVLRGVEALRGGVTVDGCGDHRMVMLASLAASVAKEPVTVLGTECLAKSWPEYLAVYRSLGGKAE